MIGVFFNSGNVDLIFWTGTLHFMKKWQWQNGLGCLFFGMDEWIVPAMLFFIIGYLQIAEHCWSFIASSMENAIG